MQKQSKLIEVLASLEKNVKNNRKRMNDLMNKSEKNADALMQNKGLIKQREERML